MVRNFRVEAYELMVEGVRASDSADLDGALYDASERVGEAIKAENLKARNYELMLLRLVREIRRVENRDRDDRELALEDLADKAAKLLARFGGSSTLR